MRQPTVFSRRSKMQSPSPPLSRPNACEQCAAASLRARRMSGTVPACKNRVRSRNDQRVGGAFSWPPPSNGVGGISILSPSGRTDVLIALRTMFHNELRLGQAQSSTPIDFGPIRQPSHSTPSAHCARLAQNRERNRSASNLSQSTATS